MPSWLLLRNTVFLRSTLVLWKTVIFLLPGLDFIPNKISPAGVAKARPLLIPALEAGNWDTGILLTDAQLPHQLKPNPDVKIREFGIGCDFTACGLLGS